METIEFARWVIETAKKKGADDAAVCITKDKSTDIVYRGKQIDQLAEATQSNLVVSIYANGRFSQHSTCDFRTETVQHLISEAILSTQYLSEDRFRTLPDPKYYPNKEVKPDLQISDARYGNIPIEERIDLAARAADAARSVSEQIISAEGCYSDQLSSSCRVNSKGFEGESQMSYFTLSCSVTAKDRAGRPEASEYAAKLFYDQLPTADGVGQRAAEKALRRIGQSKIASGKYPMLLQNRVAQQAINVVMQAIQGSAIQQKSSFLESKKGQRIASPLLTIVDDPFVVGGIGSRYFDAEGLAAQRIPIIEDGVLQNFYVNSYYAKKLNIEPTSGSSSNLIWTLGNRSCEEIISDLPRAIYVTSFLGGNANSTTGDFSYGISGFLIENGVIVQPINEMNITGNASDLLMQLLEVGNDPFPYSSNLRPSLLFDSVSFSGL